MTIWRDRLRTVFEGEPRPASARRRPIARIDPPRRPLPQDAKLYVWVSDVHWPSEDPAAWAVWLRFLKAVQPHEVICGGDLFDFESVSKHGAPGPVTPLLREEVDYGRRKIEAICEAAPEARRVWINGNHEWRVDRWLENTPLDGLASVDDIVGLTSEFGFSEVFPYGGPDGMYTPQVNGAPAKVSFTHGNKVGLNHARAMLAQYGCNIIYGHTHRPQSLVTRCGRGQLRGAWGTGGLTSLAPEYMRKNGPSDWAHGFATVWVYGDGSFSVENVVIHEGRFAWGGEVFY